jgi:hypothetical protein
MHVVGRKLSSVVVAVALLGVAANVAVASSAGAAGVTTVVVSYGDLAPNGPWSLEPSSNTGSYAFVNGPATTPGGTGSLAMNIASGQHEWLNNYAYGKCATGSACNSPASMTPIANFDALSFSTYRATGSTTPSFNIEVYVTGTSGYTTLVFVPNSTAVVDGIWQTWDAMSLPDGVWYSSRNVGSGAFNCASFSCSATWAEIVTSYPSAKVVYGLGPNVGSGGTFSGNVDNFTVGVSGDVKVYDFERVECTSTCSVDPVNGDDSNTGWPSNPLKTIQAGVNKVQAGGTVLLSAGTFAENVTVPKSVDIQGSGTSTVVVPAVSNPNCGGGGGGSLCTGASNVFLVQHDGVTIDHLTVDGDNPGLTSGTTAGGVDLDARNGIITDHSLGIFNSLSVHDVTVKNVFLRGVYASSGGSFNFTNDTIDNVQADPSSVAMFNFGGSGIMTANHVSRANDAIAANHSAGTSFTGNTVTTSGSGVHTDNAGDGGGSADVITGNNVSACSSGGYGVWTFIAFIAPTVANNVVSGCDVGLAAFGSCELDATCPGGVTPTLTYSGNQVTGTAGGLGLYASTSGLGFGDADLKLNADHNTLTGAADGVYVEKTGAKNATVVLTRNSLAGNGTHGVNNAGVTSVSARCNWWGSSSGPATGYTAGAVSTRPWLVSSNLAGNCLPVARLAAVKKTVREGNSGSTALAVTVTLDRPSNVTVSVPWHTMDGTATAADNDYASASGTVTFAAGQTTKNLVVTINGDTTIEDYQSFYVKLDPPTNAIRGVSQQEIQILNDDKPPIISQNLYSLTEGQVGNFRPHLSVRYYQTFTATASTHDQTAHAPGDYTAVVNQTLTFVAGTTTWLTVSVATHTDGVTENHETFTLTITSVGVPNSPVTTQGNIKANTT